MDIQIGISIGGCALFGVDFDVKTEPLSGRRGLSWVRI